MSNDIRSLAARANEFVSKNRLEEAAACYRKICKLDKNNIDALINYGALCARSGDHINARDAFERACALGKHFGKQHEYLLNLLIQQNDLQGSMSRISTLADTPGAPRDLLSRAGMLFGSQGAFDKAIEAFRQQIVLHGEDKDTCYGLASAYQQKGDHPSAIEFYHKAISYAPGDAAMRNSLGACLELAGDLSSAIEQYSKAVEYDAEHAPSRYNLAKACFRMSEFEQAQAHFAAASRLLPDNAQVHAMLGVCNFYLNRYDLAIPASQRALSLEPGNLVASLNLANCMIAGGQFDDAENILSAAQEGKPDDPELAAALSQLYEKRGDSDKAMRCIEATAQLHPSHPDVASAYALAARSPEQQAEALRLIRLATQDDKLWPGKRIALHYTAGKILDRQKRYDEAFDQYRTANELQSYRYDHDAYLELADRIKQAYPIDDSAHAMDIPDGSPRPVFIIGMPRSGTTLVEQILASHPDVSAAGELQCIERLMSRSYPALLSLDQGRSKTAPQESPGLAELAREYLDQATSNIPKNVFFTDKMPHNFQYLGFIKSLLKGVRIVHVTRDRMDTCLSIFFSNFNKRQRYSSDMDNILRYHDEFYLYLMDHWHDIYAGSILRIAYEDIVADQGTQTRRLLDYVGLGWDERCMNFHEHTRNVVTPSYDQVRQPLYSRSVGRWKNYETLLDTVRK